MSGGGGGGWGGGGSGRQTGRGRQRVEDGDHKRILDTLHFLAEVTIFRKK